MADAVVSGLLLHLPHSLEDGRDGLSSWFADAHERDDFFGCHENFLVSEAACEPEPQIASREFKNLGDSAVRNDIAILGCSFRELQSMIKFLGDLEDALVAAGLEAVCSVSDEVHPTVKRGCCPEDGQADAVITIKKSGEKARKNAFHFLVVGQNLSDGLPKGFTVLFTRAAYLVSGLHNASPRALAVVQGGACHE